MIEIKWFWFLDLQDINTEIQNGSQSDGGEAGERMEGRWGLYVELIGHDPKNMGCPLRFLQPLALYALKEVEGEDVKVAAIG